MVRVVPGFVRYSYLDRLKTMSPGTSATLPTAAALLLIAASACASPGSDTHGDTPPVGYTKTAKTDCGYPVCDSIMHVPGISPVPPTSLEAIALVCNGTAHCEGFNSNGWLKRCLPPRCPAATKGMEPGSPCDLYTKLGPPHNGPPPPPPPPSPPAPVADLTDAYYPAEEAAEAAAAAVPTLVSATGVACLLRPPTGGAAVTASQGDVVFDGNWTVLAILPSPGSAESAGPAVAGGSGMVALERRWDRWGLIVYLTAGVAEPVASLRKPLGRLELTKTSRYNLTEGEPDYFIKVPFLDLPLPFHCLSFTFHCLFAAFPLPFLAFSLPFLDLPLPFHCLSLTFRCLSTAFPCLSLSSRCL